MGLNWRQRQKQELRRQIYDTSVELFVAHGYEATTVRQITEALGLAKGTFFNHFPSKEHVVAEWYDGITQRSLAAARERSTTEAEAVDDTEDVIGSLFADMAAQATRVPELLIAKSSHGTHPLLVEAERAQVEGLLAFLREHCEGAVRRGGVAESLDVEAFCGLLVAVLTGTSRSWVTSDPRFDFPETIRRRVSFLFRAARAGH